MTEQTMRTLEDWLEQLIAAPLLDKRAVTIEALSAGIALEPVRCVLHGLTVTFIGAYRHLAETEPEWRRTNPTAPEDALQHRPHSLRPARREEGAPPPPWSSSKCRSCGAEIVWADTMKGKRHPVDFAPDPAGRIQFVRQPSFPDDPDGLDSPPLAVFLHTLGERDAALEGSLHTSHFETCPNAADWRRSPGTPPKGT